jgi:hypothetical protein
MNPDYHIEFIPISPHNSTNRCTQFSTYRSTGTFDIDRTRNSVALSPIVNFQVAPEVRGTSLPTIAAAFVCLPDPFFGPASLLHECAADAATAKNETTVKPNQGERWL